MPVLRQWNLRHAMVNDLASLARRIDLFFVPNITLRKFHVISPVLRVRDIKNPHALPLRLKPIAQQRPEISRPAGDECLAHVKNLFPAPCTKSSNAASPLPALPPACIPVPFRPAPLSTLWFCSSPTTHVSFGGTSRPIAASHPPSARFRWRNAAAASVY